MREVIGWVVFGIGICCCIAFGIQKCHDYEIGELRIKENTKRMYIKKGYTRKRIPTRWEEQWIKDSCEVKEVK